jgi:hypothetical protein
MDREFGPRKIRDKRCKLMDRGCTAVVGPGVATGRSNDHAKSAHPYGTMVDMPEGQPFDDDIAQDGLAKVIRDGPHAAQIAQALFLNVGHKPEVPWEFRSTLQRPNQACQCCNSKRVVPDSRAEYPSGLTCDRQICAGRKDRIEMRANDQRRRSRARMTFARR